MTISNATPLVENKTGNGVWTTIAVTPGLIFQNSDGTHAIKVIKTTVADGTTVELVEDTDYTVALDGSSPSTGTITISAGAPSSSYRYTVISNLTATQEVDLQNGTIVNMENIESALDKLTLLHQVQQEKLERAVILAEDTLVRNLTLDALDGQTGKVLRVNAAEDGFDYTSTTTTISDGDYGDITVGSSGTTMTIDDDAVTLAKMASGTAGNLITYDASGNPAAVSTGTSGQVLTSNGAGAAPTFQNAAGGGVGSWEFISSVTVGAGESSWEFTGLTGAYDEYRIVIRGLTRDAGTSGTLRMQVALSGTSYLTSSAYANHYLVGTSTTFASGTITSFYLTAANVTGGFSGIADIRDGDSASFVSLESCVLPYNTQPAIAASQHLNHGTLTSASTDYRGSITAINVFISTSTSMTCGSGTITLYGYSYPTS